MSCSHHRMEDLDDGSRVCRDCGQSEQPSTDPLAIEVAKMAFEAGFKGSATFYEFAETFYKPGKEHHNEPWG